MEIKKYVRIIIISLIVVGVFSSCSLTSNTQKITEAIIEEWNNSSNFEETSFMHSLEERSEFTIDDIQEGEEEGYYEVTCSVTSPDILDSLKQYQNNSMKVETNESMNSKIIELVNNGQLKTTNQTVTVFETEDGYYVEFSEGFVDAMYGYSYSYCRNEMNNMINQLFE